MRGDEAPATLSDCQLMLQVKRGDRDAFRILYVRHAVAVTRFFFSLSGRRVEAEDLCQELFLRIWRIRDRYCISGSFKSYFYAVARLIWMERMKQKSHQRKGGWSLTQMVRSQICAKIQMI